MHRFEPMSLTFKSSKRAYGINSYALLAQWLNGMSLAVNSYLIPIQLCGGKKTKWHRCNYIYAISVFLPRFNADSRYCYYRIRQILCNPVTLFFFVFLLFVALLVISANLFIFFGRMIMHLKAILLPT